MRHSQAVKAAKLQPWVAAESSGTSYSLPILKAIKMNGTVGAEALVLQNCTNKPINFIEYTGMYV